jgi:hypothetical protein
VKNVSKFCFCEGIVSAVLRIVSSYCALASIGFSDVDKSVKECGEYYDLAWYSIAALKLMDDINLSKTRIDFANEVCLGEVRVKCEGSGV